MKKFTILILLLVTSTPFYASTSRLSTDIGMNYINFQDARFTDYKYSGSIIRFHVNFDQVSPKSVYYLKVGISGGNNPLPNLPDNTIQILELKPELGYLQNFRMEGFYIGGSLSLFDYTIRSNDVLHNNSNFFLNSNDLLATARYIKPISKALSLEFQSSVGLLSVMKYAPSFTANFPQNIIDNSLMSFQDAEIRNPISFQHMSVKTFADQTQLKFQAYAYWKKRLAIGYIWNVRSFSDFEGYPLTLANHMLTLRYNFMNKTK